MPTLVQHTPASPPSLIGGSASASFTFSLTPSASGNMQILELGAYDTSGSRSLSSISDSVDGAWSLGAAQQETSSSTPIAATYYKVASSTATRTVTVTFNGATSLYVTYAVDEWSGVLSFDKAIAGTGANPTTSTSQTAASANNLCVGIGVNDSSTNGTWTTPSGFTQSWVYPTAATDLAAQCAYLIGTSTSSYSPIWNFSSGGFNSYSVAIFNTSAAGPVLQQTTGRQVYVMP